MSGGAKINYGVLVEGLLIRWLEDVGYPPIVRDAARSRATWTDRERT